MLLMWEGCLALLGLALFWGPEDGEGTWGAGFLHHGGEMYLNGQILASLLLGRPTAGLKVRAIGKNKAEFGEQS